MQFEKNFSRELDTKLDNLESILKCVNRCEEINDRNVNSKLLYSLKVDKLLMVGNNLNTIKVEPVEWIKFLSSLDTSNKQVNKGAWEEKVRWITKAVLSMR